ncbi:MAG: DNA-binding protein YbiB, partial [Acidovorax soli]|nr:DNA-binding protein YbiB [Acidovorax soli]
KLMNPCAGAAVVVTSYTHPEYYEMLQATFGALHMTALLSRGLEGEVAADPRRTPRYDAFAAGVHQLLQEQQPGTAAEVPGLPTAIDIDTTARYTRDVLDGRLPVPAALAQQVEHILHLAAQTTRPTP